MKELVVVRHGSCIRTGSYKLNWVGRAEINLLADHLGAKLGASGEVLILTSPTERTVESAEIIKGRLGRGELRELHRLEFYHEYDPFGYERATQAVRNAIDASLAESTIVVSHRRCEEIIAGFVQGFGITVPKDLIELDTGEAWFVTNGKAEHIRIGGQALINKIIQLQPGIENKNIPDLLAQVAGYTPQRLQN